MADKNLPPSEQKVQQAREKGDVGLSKDIVGLSKLVVMSELAFATERLWRDEINQMLASAVAVIGQSRQERIQTIGTLLGQASLFAIVIACTAAAVALASTLLQTRFNVAPKAFERGMEKLNPATNLQQLVSGQKLMMLVIGPIKVSVVMTVCYFYVKGQIPNLLQLYRVNLMQGWVFTLQTLHSFVRLATLALTALAVFDFGLQRYLTWRQLRMDMEEVKREHKDNEGDPHTKGHRKQVARQMLNEPVNRKQATKTVKPDAVVVNPQHIAIALVSEQPGVTLPKIMARGSGEEALRMKDYAVAHQIPIIRYVSLARLLFATGKEGAYVPSQTVRAVALVYSAVRELQGQVIQHGDEFEISPGMAEAMLPQAGPQKPAGVAVMPVAAPVVTKPLPGQVGYLERGTR